MLHYCGVILHAMVVSYTIPCEYIKLTRIPYSIYNLVGSVVIVLYNVSKDILFMNF